ncbi:MAG: ATP-binding cassette domain-containing protein [Bacilli bacterium]|nr:ATP-binding cassette domain-containing protein [Bacilli bacterium]
MKIVLQDGYKDCGVSSLLSIIRYYGGDISKEVLREMTNTNKDGVNALNLINSAKELGFDAYGVNGEIGSLTKEDLPCIAHTIINKSLKHFIVIYSIDESKDKITIMNPEYGKKVISFSEFNLISTHNYIILKPIKKIPVFKINTFIIDNIISFIKKNVLIVLLILLLTIIYFILNILVAFHFKYLINYSINFNISENLFIISYFILILFLFREVYFLFRNILSIKLFSIFDYSITNKVFEQILFLPFNYYKNRSSGEIINIIKDLGIIRDYYSNFIIYFITDFISIIIFGIFMFNISNKITLFVFIYFIMMIILFIVSKKYFENKIIKLKKIEDRVNTKLVEGISNSLTLKNTHSEKRFVDEFSSKYNYYLNYSYKYLRSNFIYNSLKSIVNNILIVLIFLIGSYYVIKGDLLLIDLFLYEIFFNYFNTSSNRIINFIGNYNDYNISKRRVDDLFNIKREYFSNSYYYLPHNMMGNIKINNLYYKIGNNTLFNSCSLKINQGEKILIIGKSGSGKSTLMKILMRYVLIPYGMVSINDIDINHYHLDSIRSNICYVSNNEYLFFDNIYNNICLYKDYSKEEYDQVKNICLIDFCTDKDICEEGGINFSSGERQRIILARSIIKNSNIYIFDEALNQIDINKEKKILDNIFNLYKDKTIIVISHRNNNKKLFDRCIELKNGGFYER